FVKKYGIALCYDPQLPSSKQTALDAQRFFDCHFPLLNPFGVAQVTTFAETLRSRLARHTFEARTFSEPILYLASLASSWKYAPSAHSIFVDGEEMSFKNFIKKLGETSTFSTRLANQHIDVSTLFVDHSKAIDDNDHVESSFVSKNQDVAGFELVLVGDSPLDQGAAVAEG
ncbi:hypothetical protein Tco_1574581, partial [Tanacetum coccineum]